MKVAATPQYKAPELPDIATSYDPFAVAKQFDAMRSSFGAAAPFQMPEVQPKPMEYGGQLPAPAPGQFQMPKGAQRPAGATAQAAVPVRQGNSSWGALTQGIKQQFPGLRQTSGYRSPEHNASTPGSAKNSLHMQRDAQGNSRASDFVGSARDMAAAGAWAKANGAKEVIIKNAGTGIHLHVGWA